MKSDIEHRCRLCCCTSMDMINIFGRMGKERQINVKINSRLQIFVHEEDVLPHSLCVVCYGKLEKFDKFVKEVHNIQIELTRLLTRIDESTEHPIAVNVEPEVCLVRTVDGNEEHPVVTGEDSNVCSVRDQDDERCVAVCIDNHVSSESDVSNSELPDDQNDVIILDNYNDNEVIEISDSPELSPCSLTQTTDLENRHVVHCEVDGLDEQLVIQPASPEAIEQMGTDPLVEKGTAEQIVVEHMIKLPAAKQERASQRLAKQFIKEKEIQDACVQTGNSLVSELKRLQKTLSSTKHPLKGSKLVTVEEKRTTKTYSTDGISRDSAYNKSCVAKLKLGLASIDGFMAYQTLNTVRNKLCTPQYGTLRFQRL